MQIDTCLPAWAMQGKARLATKRLAASCSGLVLNLQQVPSLDHDVCDRDSLAQYKKICGCGLNLDFLCACARARACDSLGRPEVEKHTIPRTL